MLNTKNNLTSAGRAKLLRQQRQYKIEDAKRIQEEQKIIEKKNNASIWEKIGDTLYDFGANIVGGASKAVEGVVDTGSSIAGNIAGWFGADDFKQKMQENIAYDWTGNNITNPANEKTDASLLNNGKFGQYIEGMAQGVGQLLPNVVLTVATGGTATGIKIGSIASKITLFGSAMGNSTEQAVNEGADLGTASIYGALSGGVELLSERISGKLFGAGKIDRALGFKENLGRSLFKSAKSGLGRMAQEAVGEGLEEAFAEAVNPLLKKWTYDPNVKNATFGEIWDSAVVGALTSIAFGGTVGQLPTYKNASRVSRIQDQVNEYNDAVDKLYQDATTGKINAEERQTRQDELAKRKVVVEENVAQIMQEFDKGWNITNKIRQKGKLQALDTINASGNLKMGLNSEGKLVGVQENINQQNQPVNVVASLDKAGKDVYKTVNRNELNKQAYSTTLEGKENRIVYQPTQSELTPQMKESLTMMSDLSKAFGHNIDYVVADKKAMAGRKGALDKTNNVLYLREDIDSSQVIQETIVHEFTHSLEGTSAYKVMANFVKSQLKFNKNLAKEFGIENFEAEYDALFNKYKRVMDINLTEAQQKEYVDTELIAKYISEKLFTDKQSIQEVCKTNPTLAQKVFNWIKNVFDKLTGKTRGERFAKSFLLKAKNLYSIAIQDAGITRSADNVESAKTTQNLDNNSNVKYSFDNKKISKYPTYSQWKTEALAWASKADKDSYRGFYDGKGNFKVIIATGNDLVYDELVTVPENNQNLVTYYKGVIDGHNETLNRDAKEVSECFKDLSNNTGFSNNNRSDVARRRTDSEIRTMDATKSDGIRERNVKESSGNLSTKIKSYIYGDGYSTENVNIKEYNLVDVKEKGKLRDLLRELNSSIKTNKSMIQSKDLRLGLFTCLQNQNNNVYSKLAEINTAYEKTVSAYNKNNAINIPQTFIQALGYNGVIDGKDGVVYDLNNKKKSLLDYSEDRAKERLDKAIRLFGETDNPAKAGWLLADGRFVDYNRDSSNILTGDVFDYQDHWQIEKVFDTRRGTDAIDAFMAEGNIRLMPEAGGIELRGKPNKNQVDKLEEFINKVIDKEGITLDLRPAGTTENQKPNPVFYDNTASVKEVMQGINSYYNTGKVAKVVDGMKFSLEEDFATQVDNILNGSDTVNTHLQVRPDTPKILLDAGLDNKRMLITANHTKTAVGIETKKSNTHNLDIETLKKLPKLLDNPVIIMDSLKEGSVVVFVNAKDKNGTPIMCAININGVGNYNNIEVETNLISSVYGKNSGLTSFIERAVNENRLIFWNKKMSLELFNTPGLQLPNNIKQVDSNTIIHQISKKSTDNLKFSIEEDFNNENEVKEYYDKAISESYAKYKEVDPFRFRINEKQRDAFQKYLDERELLEQEKKEMLKKVRLKISSKDSDGNTLTPEQQRYFRGSKVVDENGRLKVCYHGTSELFNEFSYKYLGKNGTSYGKGFYFSDSKQYSEGFTTETGRLMKVYLKIKKPLSLTKKHISVDKMRTFVRTLSRYKTEDGINLLSDYADIDTYGINTAINECVNLEYENNDNDVDLIHSIYNRISGIELSEYYRLLNESLGYDGIVEEGENETFYVTFQSKQIRNIDNKNPTNSDDIRYSLDDEVDNKQSKNVEYKMIKGVSESEIHPRLQNAIVEYAQRFVKNQKKYVQESIAEWEEKLAKEKSTTNVPMRLKIINERLEKLYAEQNKFKEQYKILRSKTGEWMLGEIHREGISRLSQKDASKEINGHKETISLLEYLIRHEKFYKTYNNIEGYRMKIVEKTILPKVFHDIIKENETMGMRTFFFVDDAFNGDTNETEGFCGMCMADGRIFLKIAYDNPDFIETNKHERLHYIKNNHEDIYNNFKNQILKLLTDEEKLDLYNKYYDKYEDAYNLTLEDFESKANERVWEEVFAQIYAEAEVPINKRKIDFIIGEFDESLKKTFNLKNDIQFSLEDDPLDILQQDIPSNEGFFNAENIKGQTRDTDAIKYRAKLKQDKVFSKEELSKVISDALNKTQNMRLSGKVKDTAIGELFERMNTQDVYEKRKTAQDIADFIINNAFYDEIYTETYEQQVAEFELIDSHKGHFKLNEQIKQELDIKTENGARIVSAWSEKGYNVLADGTKKNKTGVNPFDVAEDLISLGLMIDTDKSETEIFLDIYERYNALDESIKEFKSNQKELAKDKLDSVTMRDNKQALVDTILKAYDEKGSKTASAKLKELYHENMSKIKAELKDVKKYANAYVNYLVSNKRAKELVKGNKHYSAGVLENPTLKGFLKAIAQTGNIKTIKRTARARIQKLAEVYNTSKKGSLFNDILGQEQEMTEIFGVKDSVYDENIANMIEYIAQGQGELTTDEIILLTKITDGLIHLYTTYDKVFKNGKYVETEKLAKDYGEKMRVGIDVRNKSKLLKGMWRFRAMFDPHTVMRNLDGYRCEYNEELGVIEDRGFFTEMFQDITDGEVKANVAELELLKPFGDFFKSYKGFERSLTKDKLKLNGTQIKTNGVKVKTEVEMSIGEAISIYLTSLRPQSNFYDSSVILQNKDKTTSEYSFNVKQVNELFGKFTEAQKEYIKLVQKFFNEDAQKLKVETDLETLGYTNIEDSGVYFPINREKSAIAKNLGDTQVILDAINTYTLSFNKDIKPGAKLPIRISNVYGIVQNHAKGIGAYYGLSVPLKTFNRVFNKQIESMGKQSLKRIASSQLYGSVEYVDKLLKDIQGRHYDNTVGGKVLRWMRGNYAKFQLGFNPKTILGQTSSYMMASTYLDADALAKGLVMKTNTEQMFKYAPFTKYRMQEKAIVKAQGVIDKVGKFGDLFTKGIGWMDNNVVKKLWNASQVQVEKNTGHKVGTEENLNRASKLLERVVRETQSNSIASEMTSLARSENEVLASLTMFSSDAQKQASRLVDGLALLSATKQWIANGTLKANDKIAKIAKKQIFRAGAGFVTATTMYVLIGMMMKYLLGKNDEEETITEEFFGDFKSQVAGLIPIYRDVYGYMNDGYELNNYAYAMINDALAGTKAGKELIEDLLSGKQLSKSEIGMPLRKSIYAVSQLLGVPVRNVWNYGYGIVNQFSPSTAYRMNSLFYDAKLTDLDKSIESGNDRKSIAIIKELFESKNLDIDNNYAQEVLGLYKEGFNVIPSEIKESFSYNGEELTLTSVQHKQLLNAMNDVLAGFNDIVKQAEYKKLSATQKRTYLNNLYDINYILNLAQVIGLDNMKDSDIKKCLFANVLGSDLISYMAYIKTFESDKDKEGNTITNSKKIKIQNWVKRLKLAPAEKYLLMGFAGYKNINGESAVNVYLRRKGLSKDERELVLKWCGY